MAQTAEAYLINVANQVDIRPSTAHYYRQIVTTIIELGLI